MVSIYTETKLIEYYQLQIAIRNKLPAVRKKKSRCYKELRDKAIRDRKT